jgi:hypothetical protein
MKFAIGFLEERKRSGNHEVDRALEDRQEQRRAYVASARQRCREFRELRYCARCHLALQAFQSICEHCGEATEPLPSAYALDYAREEFPDLVESREDYDKLIG